MNTDVFPEEDSVRVVWAPVCDCQQCKEEGASHDWIVKSRSKRGGQLRFSVGACGQLDGSNERCLDASAPEDNCGADYVERASIDELQAYGWSPDSNAYFEGLMGRKYLAADTRARDAYSMGVEEAQLIDWQA